MNDPHIIRDQPPSENCEICGAALRTRRTTRPYRVGMSMQELSAIIAAGRWTAPDPRLTSAI